MACGTKKIEIYRGLNFKKNKHFRPIAPKIFFVPNISPSKVGVIGVLLDKGAKRHQKDIFIAVNRDLFQKIQIRKWKRSIFFF